MGRPSGVRAGRHCGHRPSLGVLGYTQSQVKGRQYEGRVDLLGPGG